MDVRTNSGAGLDASFTLNDQGDGSWLLTYESSGGRAGGPNPRNLDYRTALSLIFERMKRYGVVVTEIRVESQQTIRLPATERTVKLEGHRMPLRMRQVEDLEELRKDISRNARLVGTKNMTSRGGSSRRMVFVVDPTGHSNASTLQRLLASGA